MSKISTTLSGKQFPFIAGRKKLAKVEDPEAHEKFIAEQREIRSKVHYDYDGCIELLGGYSKI